MKKHICFNLEKSGLESTVKIASVVVTIISDRREGGIMDIIMECKNVDYSYPTLQQNLQLSI